MSYLSLLDCIITHIPISDIPEHIVRQYLPGDACLDFCNTIDLVFTTPYYSTHESRHESYFFTYLDPHRKVPHSFGDQPARLCGRLRWYRNGKLHRDNDKPAFFVDYGDSTIEQHFKHGILHREWDKPAIEIRYKYKLIQKWYKNGQPHRLYQPAVVISKYYNKGQRCTEDGQPVTNGYRSDEDEYHEDHDKELM